MFLVINFDLSKKKFLLYLRQSKKSTGAAFRAAFVKNKKVKIYKELVAFIVSTIKTRVFVVATAAAFLFFILHTKLMRNKRNL